MGTTIFPLPAGGPSDDDGPNFPTSAGQGMGFEQLSRLRESKKRRKSPKQLIKEAEGVLNPPRSRAKTVKMGKRPENLRASRKKKSGPFGEAYTPISAGRKKGIRVAESASGFANRTVEALLRNPTAFGRVLKGYRESRFFAESDRFWEKAPPGWEGTVKHMKKHKDIDNPWALANYMDDQGYTPHH